MPRIRTYTVNYTISPNRHSADVNVMYDTNRKVFFVAVPDAFTDCVNTMSDELKDRFNIRPATGLRNTYGPVVIHEQEDEVINVLEDLFYYCGNAVKVVRNVIIVTCLGKSNEDATQWSAMGCNKERFKLEQAFSFVLAIETKVGEGRPIYTYQGVTYTNTIEVYEKNIVIDDTPENRLFLEDVYEKFNNLILGLKKFFKNSDAVLELIASNLKLLN